MKPSVFGDDVIGHQTILHLLETWLPNPAPAYVFVGPSHVGKRTIAERFVRLLLGRPVDDSSWMSHPDLVRLEPEEGKTQISVEHVRDARERLATRPLLAPRIVAYVPHADRLNESGLNALLKVLEEPRAGAVFVLVVEDLQRLPLTVQSRCVTFPFSIVPSAEIVTGLLQRGMSKKDAEERARAAHGRPGVAISGEQETEASASFVDEMFTAATTGKRLTIIERLALTCESSEDPTSAWRDAISSAMHAVSHNMLEQPIPASVLGTGLLAAHRSIGTAISPRLALEACAVRWPDLVLSRLRESFPTHISSTIPFMYTVSL